MNDRDGNTCDGDIISDLIGGLEHSGIIRSSLDRSTGRSHHGSAICDDLPIPMLFYLLFLSSPVLNMTLNCINYALCFMTTTDTWNEALVKIPWYRYNS